MLLLEQVVLPSAQNSHMQEISLTHSLGPKLRSHNVLQALKSMFSPARGYVDLNPSIEKETLTTYPFNQPSSGETSYSFNRISYFWNISNIPLKRDTDGMIYHGIKARHWLAVYVIDKNFKKLFIHFRT